MRTWIGLRFLPTHNPIQRGLGFRLMRTFHQALVSIDADAAALHTVRSASDRSLALSELNPLSLDLGAPASPRRVHVATSQLAGETPALPGDLLQVFH